jgi:hypothetical protein
MPAMLAANSMCPSQLLQEHFRYESLMVPLVYGTKRTILEPEFLRYFETGAISGIGKELDFDPGSAVLDDSQLAGSGQGEVDDPFAGEGPAVIDADDHCAIVGQIGDPNVSAKRKGTMGCGHLPHVVNLAAGGAAALIFLAVE